MFAMSTGDTRISGYFERQKSGLFYVNITLATSSGYREFEDEEFELI